MKIIWNKTFIIVYLMTFLSQSWLFGQGEPSVGEWRIEDYKKAIMSEYLDKKDEILEFEEFAAFETGEKGFLCKWSSKWESSKGTRETIYFDFFVFNKKHEFKEKLVGLQMDEPKIEAIAQGMPGVRLWDAPVFIGDFNKDGQDEIASFFNTASAPTFQIVGIDLDSKNLVCYFDQEIGFGGRLKPTLTPVEFMRYKNMDGFKMLRMVPPDERPSVKYPYDDYEGYNGYRGLAWFFYKWDKREKEYVIVEEIDPYYSNETKIDISESEEKISSFQYEVKNKKSNFYIIIIVSIIVLAALTVIIIVKRKIV